MNDMPGASLKHSTTHEMNGEQQKNHLASSALSGVSIEFVIRVQAASRAILAKGGLHRSSSEDRLSRVSSAPSLTCLTRDARYARAEAALRVALSRCDTEPSPLELQVRVMEKGLQSWNARAGRGYERVRKAEEALAAVHREEEDSGMERGGMGDLQREKWMGMKERDEALEMVEKIKGLIAELNADIKGGLKAHSKSEVTNPLPAKLSHQRPDSTASDTTPSQKAPILFSGRLPPPYLENLPRSRRSVEPLRLTPRHPRVTRHRSSTHSESAAHSPSTPSTTQPSTPRPSTPTNVFDEFGAALIHTPLPPKSMAQYIAEMNEFDAPHAAQGSKRTRGHTRLPSYVGDLLDEFSEDRIGDGSLGLDAAFEASSPGSSSPPRTPVPDQRIFRSPPPAPSTPTPTKRRSKAFLGRPFGSPSSVPSSPASSVQSPRSKEDRDTSLSRNPRSDSAAAFEKHLQTFLSAPSSASASSSSAPSTPALDASHPAKSPGRMGNIVQSVRKGVKRVVRMGEN